MPSSMSNRRVSERKHLVYYLQVVDRNTNQPVGRLVDITAEGLMLVSDYPLATNTIFNLRMILPVGAPEGQHLDFDAKSLWCSNDINPEFYDTGFQLLNATSEEIETIENLIADYGFPESY